MRVGEERVGVLGDKLVSRGTDVPGHVQTYSMHVAMLCVSVGWLGWELWDFSVDTTF